MKKVGNAEQEATKAASPRLTAASRVKLSSFTLIELLAVMAVILILAGLVLSLASYLQTKGAQSRAQAEIQGLENACESYKTDNGVYPQATGTTDVLYARTMDLSSTANVTKYQTASLYLYAALTGDVGYSGSATLSYFPIKPAMCMRPNMNSPISSSNQVNCLMDPWGNSYGYSTAGVTNGYNPTFDIWSTAGSLSGTNSLVWVKNW